MEQDVKSLKHSKVDVVKAVIVLCLFIVCLFFIWRQKTNNVEYVQTNTGEESTLTVKAIKESTDYTDIDAQIPQFKNASGDFNKKIEQYVRDRINEHKQETQENWQSRFDTQGPDGDLPKVPTGDGDKMYFYANFQAPEQNNNEYISILMKFSGYNGGAHGYEDVISYNFDVKNKKELTLSNLFKNDPDYLNKISQMSRKILVDRFTESFGGDFESVKEKELYIKETIEPMVYEGTNPINPDNFVNFTFTKDKLIIHFGQYQVGPYVAGLQDVEMPLSLLEQSM